MEKPNLSKQAFWDVDFDNMDYQKKADFIIGRVFEYGTLTDLKSCLKFYGFERCKVAIINAKFLKSNAINTASLIFEIPRTTIQCFNTKPLHLPF
jgi:hypothetical protein